MQDKTSLYNPLYVICGICLFLSLLSLPIGYFTFLRILVTIGALLIIVNDAKAGLSFWVIAFVLVAIIFNPIFPVYLHDKSIWMPIDVIAGLLFFGRVVYN